MRSESAQQATLLERVLRISDRIIQVVEEWIPGALIGAMAVGVTVSVFARYVLHRPFQGVPELATGALVWIVFVGGAAVTRRGLHVALDVITNLFKWRSQAIFAILASAATIATLILLLVWSWDLTLGTHRILPMTGISAKFVWGALPLGAALMILRELSNIGHAINGIRGGDFAYPNVSFEDSFGLEEM